MFSGEPDRKAFAMHGPCLFLYVLGSNRSSCKMRKPLGTLRTSLLAYGREKTVFETHGLLFWASFGGLTIII